MRPQRFQDFVVDLLKNSTGVTRVQPLSEAGDSRHPFGVAVTGPGGEARWQIVGQLASGTRHDDPDTPVEGQPAPVVEPQAGDNAEGWLAAVLSAAESPEIERIERWSTREDGSSQGVTVCFHNSARIFMRKV
ncbi:hypothetical protein ADK70_12620 [Streptomyces rimosus subsp. pseudoverticillatus]|uniref:hypothetical protein n=1 Tax=Streptomyces rimosus TaxID=1927 RepID=UPI0006B28294|nr:hypothetical protein [Streptomyces rimosus]KOT94513.1 hypothetical protein ADK70_12620 [Streptomyces rimosus subsp. pseudoverticillatus]